MTIKFKPRTSEPRATYSRTVYDDVIAIVDTGALTVIPASTRAT